MDLSAQDLTEAVLARYGAAPDPRMREILASLIRHLHGFIREVAPSFAEWRAAIDFLTATGKACTPERQEFILLSDVLGASMLVDALNHRFPPEATPSTVLGPFFVEDAPALPLGADLAEGIEGLAAERLFVAGTVRDLEGRPLPGARLEVWHADAEGFYDVQRDPRWRALRGRFESDAAGRFHFWTLQPASYPVPHDGPVGRLLAAGGRHPFRPAHVHFMISAPGHRTLVTHVFVAGDPYLDSDAVFGVKSALIAEFRRMPPGEAPDGRIMEAPWRHLAYDFTLTPALAPGAAAEG
jgi:hydroxyquinol 1,2-dioxygenase